MASTYSTNLALELIGTGEQAGTWGTTTNTNLGTLLEQAISGYVTQAITDGSGANTTITIPNGATGVARNMFLELTGALTFSTTSLIVPANKKLYFIYNNTTGGFAVTVKVSGQTGVSVPNGGKVILVCNGTDIVEAHTAVSGNATVGGTLGVTGAATLSSTLGVTGAATLSSTLGVTGAATLSSTLTVAGALNASSGSVFRKNAIINGDFQIWQEETSFAAMASATYMADNWQYVKVGAMVHTGSRSTDVPTIAEAGRKILYSLLIDCTTADASIAAGDVCYVRAYVEGYNFNYIAGVGLCLQFWHKHTKTGTYCVAFGNSNGDRSFVREYTQAVSDTWELATVLVDASPSAGTWDYTTGIGYVVYFSMAAGTDFHGTAGSWNSAFDLATSNQVNACDNVANNFRLAGVQLEKGSVATEFDARTYQDELALCQRYYYQSTGPIHHYVLGNGVTGTAYICGTFALPVPMRINPTKTKVGTWIVTNCDQPTVLGNDTHKYTLYASTSTTGNATFYGDSTNIFTASARF